MLLAAILTGWWWVGKAEAWEPLFAAETGATSVSGTLPARPPTTAAKPPVAAVVTPPPAPPAVVTPPPAPPAVVTPPPAPPAVAPPPPAAAKPVPPAVAPSPPAAAKPAAAAAPSPPAAAKPPVPPPAGAKSPPVAGGGATVVTETSSDPRATLEPGRRATLSAQMSARVNQIAVEEGSAFKAGQTLVKLDCAVPRAALAKARAEWQADQKRLEVTRRMKEMVGVSELEMTLAQSSVARSEAMVASARAETGYCEIRAPYAGRVSKRHVQPFDSVERGKSLLEIRDDATLAVRLQVPGRWAGRLQPDQRFQMILAESGRSYPARIIAVGAQVDSSGQTLVVRGELVGHFPELVPGIEGTARFDFP